MVIEFPVLNPSTGKFLVFILFLSPLACCRELDVSKIEIEGDAVNVLTVLDVIGLDLSKIWMSWMR